MWTTGRRERKVRVELDAEFYGFSLKSSHWDDVRKGDPPFTTVGRL